MAAGDQRAKSQKMAQDLKERGIWHGRRMTKPTHANYPKLTEVGSAAYRRLQMKSRAGNR